MSFCSWCTCLKTYTTVDILTQVVPCRRSISQWQPVASSFPYFHFLICRPLHTVMNDGQIKTRISLSIRILTHSFISPIKRLTVIHFKCACQIFRRASRRFPACHPHRKVRSLKTIILSVRTCPNNLLTSIILCSEQICKILIQSISQSRLVTNNLIGSFCGGNPFTFIVIRIEQRACSI